MHLDSFHAEVKPGCIHICWSHAPSSMHMHGAQTCVQCVAGFSILKTCSSVGLYAEHMDMSIHMHVHNLYRIQCCIRMLFTHGLLEHRVLSGELHLLSNTHGNQPCCNHSSDLLYQARIKAQDQAGSIVVCSNSAQYKPRCWHRCRYMQSCKHRRGTGQQCFTPLMYQTLQKLSRQVPVHAEIKK